MTDLNARLHDAEARLLEELRRQRRNLRREGPPTQPVSAQAAKAKTLSGAPMRSAHLLTWEVTKRNQFSLWVALIAQRQCESWTLRMLRFG